MYANSTAFVPRPKANFVEETGSLSVFELMSHSHLWVGLRSTNQYHSCAPDTSISKYHPKPRLTYEAMTGKSKQLMKDMVLQALETGTLSGDEVIQEIKSKHFKRVSSEWEHLRTQCTVDIVVAALCDLVSCGSVQVVQKISADWNLKDWSPCYRRVQPSQSDSVSSDSSIRPSRFMKIAKPWKLAQETNDSVEWIR